ncbi:MAG TPA: M13 family metallopeptidase [Opitutaceae bacterium]|jgi:predicted metalloendopeptidase|nr:M13 family metallopeptidase [Opitutaceae bacterium]
MKRLLPLAVLAALAAQGAINRADFDRAMKPLVDFYQYVNGGWLRTHPIPPEYTSWGTWDDIEANRQQALHALVERAAYRPGPLAPGDPLAAEEKRVGDFYASGMDVAAIQAAGLTPLRPELDAIAGVRTVDDVCREIARQHLIGVSAGFSFGSEQDPAHSTRVIAGAVQAGLGLPDRDYYFRPDPASAALRRQYQAHVEAMLRLAGQTDARAQAAAVMRLETALARASKTMVALRDPVANYHPLRPGELQALTPHFSWSAYFRRLRLAPPAVVDVGQPEFLAAFDDLLASAPAAEWRAYLRWQLLDAFAPDLSDPFANEDFAFFGRALTGTPRQRERWKRVLDAVDGALPQDIGHLYVYTNFSQGARARAQAMIGQIRAALRRRLAVLPWMDAPTRAHAIAKLDAMQVKIGYPDKWIDYAPAGIARDSFALNVLRAQRFAVRRDLDKIGRPLDRAEWDADPSDVNAFYETNLNDIVFPAGVLQPPLFEARADDALNYGGIGAVMGHEMTHGFDDEGRQYDGQGNLDDWWTAWSARQFADRSRRIVRQFDRYIAVDGLHVNGALTEGENIADLGGVKLALAALHAELAQRGLRPPPVDGFTTDQRFFIAFARVWRENTRPEELRLLLATDPHSPSRFRVDGPLSNLPEFYRAFAVPAGAPMRQAPQDRVEIW